MSNFEAKWLSIEGRQGTCTLGPSVASGLDSSLKLAAGGYAAAMLCEVHLTKICRRVQPAPDAASSEVMTSHRGKLCASEYGILHTPCSFSCVSVV